MLMTFNMCSLVGESVIIKKCGNFNIIRWNIHFHLWLMHGHCNCSVNLFPLFLHFPQCTSAQIINQRFQCHWFTNAQILFRDKTTESMQLHWSWESRAKLLSAIIVYTMVCVQLTINFRFVFIFRPTWSRRSLQWYTCRMSGEAKTPDCSSLTEFTICSLILLQISRSERCMH